MPLPQRECLNDTQRQTFHATLKPQNPRHGDTRCPLVPQSRAPSTLATPLSRSPFLPKPAATSTQQAQQHDHHRRCLRHPHLPVLVSPLSLSLFLSHWLSVSLPGCRSVDPPVFPSGWPPVRMSTRVVAYVCKNQAGHWKPSKQGWSLSDRLSVCVSARLSVCRPSFGCM